MAPPADLASLASNATPPVSGNTYLLENLRYSHYLNLGQSNPADATQNPPHLTVHEKTRSCTYMPGPFTACHLGEAAGR